MASTKLQRTFTTDHGNVYKWTYSFWVKRSKISSGDHAITAVTYSGAYQSRISFKSDDVLEVYDYRNSSYILQKKTNRKFRDTSAWYHIVVSNDNTQASADDRTKIYINGVQETSFGTNTQYSQNQKTSFNDDYPNYIGSYGSGDYFDGSMSHFHFIDGTAYAPTEFGETDSTTGEWKIKTNVSVTYGTNGFFILKDGNSVTDQSGNSNNFTVGAGTLTKTEDNPSNVFATINPLFVNDGGETNGLSNGNTRYYSNSVQSNQWNNMAMTLGASTGKYYWEVKYTQIHSTETVYGSSEGIASDLAPANHNLGEGSRSGYGYGWLCGNRNTTSNTRYLKTVAGTSTLTTDSNNTPVAVNDIVGVAFDADNGKLWFHKNGTYIDDLSGYVGNPSTGAYPYHTGIQTGQIYTAWSDVWQNSTGNDIRKEYNFGNGYFGTTAVSSAGTNASGIGIFEYDVPTGFTALSTKGLNL
jgi:hypothetical protein